MKKILISFIMCFLLIPFIVVKADNLEVTSVTATSGNGKIIVTGETDPGVLAVSIMIYSGDNLITFSNTAVNSDNQFTEEIEVTSGDYIVKCANYDGGNIISDNVSVNITNQYTVTFNTNGGSEVENQIISEGSNLVEPEDPTRDGFAFVGWYEDDTLTTEFSFTKQIIKDTTLYAKWEEIPQVIEYTVTFNTNGGSEIQDLKVNAGDQVILPQDPTRDGFRFVGWYEDDTLTTEFNSNKTIDDNLILYAKWEEEQPGIQAYRVTFNTNGGEVMDDIIIDADHLLDPPGDPQRDGFRFVGWYNASLTEEFDFNTPIESDITLYAKWEEIIRDEEYAASDGDGNSIQFMEEAGRTFKLIMIDVVPLSDEELEETVGIDRDTYNQIKDAVEEEIKEYGDLVAFYDIVVEDTISGEEIHTGPFEIKIKMTDEMKKYDIFKLAYVKDDLSIEEPIVLTVEGDYLVGTLPHLSAYVLIGDKAILTSTNPYTYDNIMMWVGLLLVSITGLLIAIKFVSKKRKSEIK